MNDSEKILSIRKKLKVWKKQFKDDGDKSIEFLSDIKNNGGTLPESTVTLERVLNELDEVFSE